MPQSSEQNEPSRDLVALRQSAIRVVKRLVDAGHTAYFAGGCVRDRLMGLEPDDYDVATSARPQEVTRVFPKAQAVGESFGVLLVRQKDHVIQVATFRTEGVYSDGRHPDTVEFSDARHDASRRDFTINGLFENPLTDEVIDYVAGRKDLEARVVRAIGDADARIREDRLRMLRAVRFAARFGFAIDPETADAIRRSANELKGVSRERIGQEIKRMLMDPNRAVAAWEVQSLGLDSQVLSEPGSRVPVTRLSGLEDVVEYPTALAAWLLDRHAVSTSDLMPIADRWANSLVLSNDEQSGLVELLDLYRVLSTDWIRLGVARQKRLAAGDRFGQALLLLQAADRSAFMEIRQRVQELSKTSLAPRPFVDGSDLIQIGLKPGPVFGQVLTAVYDAQLEGTVHDKTEALGLARSLAVTFQQV